jgi:hypothetical protein
MPRGDDLEERNTRTEAIMLGMHVYDRKKVRQKARIVSTRGMRVQRKEWIEGGGGGGTQLQFRHLFGNPRLFKSLVDLTNSR